MKRKKALALIEATLDRQRAYAGPVTVDTLAIDFENRTVLFRGRRIEVQTTGVAFPIVSTDRLVISNDGRVL